MIEFKNVYKKYENNNNTAINDLNLQIKDGDFFVLVGPSGSGKTTTLKMINRLIKQTSGEITIDGKNIDDFNLQEMRLQMGYVLQNIALFPNMTIEDNITIQPESLKWSKEKRHQVAWDLLEKVGLDPDKYAKRLPNELSGGEQQRVGIVRALASNPKIVLMDEPFSALDPISRNQLQELVLKLHAEMNMTFVFVTHDMNEAVRLGNTIAIMRLGHLEQIGTRDEIVHNPKNNFVNGFFKNQQNDDKKLKLIIDSQDCQQVDRQQADLSEEDNVSDLAGLLKIQDFVLVKSSDERVWKLTTQSLLNYLARDGE
ncbi:ABC transporter ATP-binding protein [Companilactobacillus nodensis]|uniref:ABC-type quaternary amine transporter n=1 Tax=Companilactobacillus nodensis DSM 19682 = JCM 14932 = NBRC 107160 TaxID=1423775 RepID=A0A0R1K5R7_9LACO|nr:ABC transporter ATP-binding protein [Companilactobacillus nodensis]KRK78584.1 ABC-type proline glycine betaine transport system, ATPase component [Companilactobacillus nodensis DSM 19682 = JCM 14932 = NBRC 107160]